MHVHKSMLLRGIKFNPPTLTREDIEATKGRASHSGRSHGGAPLGRGRGRGRGGQINYADDRPNPFAAHVNPNFGPPPSFGRGGPPPPPRGGPFNGYPPPPPKYNGLQPPGHSNYYPPPPPQQFNGRYTGPPQNHPGGYGNFPPQGPPNGYDIGNYGHSQGSRYGGYNGNSR